VKASTRLMTKSEMRLCMAPLPGLLLSLQTLQATPIPVQQIRIRQNYQTLMLPSSVKCCTGTETARGW
jgi:hypothetical protein